jgi:excisionase family DNA binding protein
MTPVARDILLNVDDAAERLGISSGTLRNWISARRIEFVRIGKLTKIRQATVDRFIATHTIPAKQEVD